MHDVDTFGKVIVRADRDGEFKSVRIESVEFLAEIVEVTPETNIQMKIADGTGFKNLESKAESKEKASKQEAADRKVQIESGHHAGAQNGNNVSVDGDAQARNPFARAQRPTLKQFLEKINYPKVKQARPKSSHGHPYMTRKQHLWLEPNLKSTDNKGSLGWHQTMARKQPE